MSEADSEPASPEIEGGALAVEAEPPPTQMVQRERQAGWMVLAVVAAGVVGSWAADVVNGDGKALALAAIGLGLLGVLGAAVWYGRRMITAFAAMAAGIAPVKAGYAVMSFACLGYGGYLMFRSTLAQRKAAMARPRRVRPPRPARGARGARTRAGKTGAGPGPAAEGARRPGANRRYTPPKAKSPRRGR